MRVLGLASPARSEYWDKPQDHISPAHLPRFLIHKTRLWVHSIHWCMEGGRSLPLQSNYKKHIRNEGQGLNHELTKRLEIHHKYTSSHWDQYPAS
jgi:hypothetical protein